mgnify:FL=1
MEKKQVSDMERNNKIAMLCHITEAVLYIGTFLGELAAGNRDLLYVLIVAVLAGGPVAAELFFWTRNREAQAIKHLVAVGYAVLYSFVIFTTTNAVLYVYVIPIVFVVCVYNDIAYIIKICTGIIIENLIVAIAGMMNGSFGFVNFGSSLSQITVIVMVAIYSIMTVKTLQNNNDQKLRIVEEANKKTEELLSNMEHVANAMKTGIDDIYEKIDKLSEASKRTKGAMSEVSSGIMETAETVQKQLEQTEEIQKKVDHVSNASDAIHQSMDETMRILQSGENDIRILVEEVEVSVQKGDNVTKQLQELDEYMDKMNSIVELIQGITSQTSLLALNASIEAARAGEAGRGFSVVATEISGMAVQTKEATVQITELIQNVTGAINSVVEVVRDMIEGINHEKKSTQNTADSFWYIRKNTDAIRDNIKQLAKDVEELNRANTEIASSVQTISQVSEEVAAHAAQTLSAEEQNMQHLNGINDLSLIHI